VTIDDESVDDARRDCPYVGLTAFDEEDADFFFGREREIDLVIANLKATRITLLYGESGVGKSSILRAGVMPRLHAEMERNRRRRLQKPVTEDRLPLAVALFRGPWLAPPLEPLMAEVHAAVQQAVGEEVPAWDPDDDDNDVVETLRAWTRRVRTILIVLDQVEEYFLYHQVDEGPGTVAGTFAAVVNDPNLRVNFLLSIREDALAKLDNLKKTTPIYGNVLRIPYLADDAAEDAIQKPLARWNELKGNGGGPYRAEPALVEEILHEVKPAALAPGVDGDDDQTNGVAPHGIDTPVLQLVLTRLWDEEQSLSSHVLRLETFRDRLEGVESIVRTQLDPTMARLTEDERDIAAQSFRHLVTPSMSKIALSATDLEDYVGVPRDDVANVLEKLSAEDRDRSGTGRILRPVAPPPGQNETRYEIFHDALGKPVLDWSARHLEARGREDAKREASAQFRRRTKAVAIVGAASIAVAVGFLLFALQTINQKSDAESRRHAAQSVALLGFDPHRSISAALDGLDESETDEAETSLREAMSQSRLRFVYDSPAGVAKAAYSPQGSWLISAEEGGSAHLLNTRSGERHDLGSHGAFVNDVGFNSTGTRAVTAGDDGTARVWDVTSGELVGEPLEHGQAVYSGSFSPSEALVLTASLDGTARIWNADTGEQQAALGTPPSDHYLTFAGFSPNGDWAVTTESAFDKESGATIRLWRRPASGWQEARKATHVLSGHTGSIYVASFSPDGKHLVTGGDDPTARIWNVSSGRLVHELEGHQRYVANAIFSPDSTVVATVSEKTLRFWDVRDGSLFHKSLASTDWVSTVDFRRPDGDLIVTAGAEGVARVWEVATGALLFELRGHTDPIATAAFTPDGKSVVTASWDGTARVWDATTGREFRRHTDWVHDATFSGDGAHVFTVSADHYLAKWNAATGEQVWEFPDGSGETLNGVDVDPSGRFVVSVGDNPRSVVWNAETGEEVVALETDADADLSGHSDVVVTGAFDPREGERHIATGGVDERVLIWTWEGDRAQVVRELDAGRPGIFGGVAAHRGAVFSVTYSQDGSRLVTAGEDRMVRVWNPDTGELLATFEGHGGKVGGAAFDPTGELVASASEDWTVRVWRVDGGRPPMTLGGAGGPLRAVAFSRDGRLIAAAGSAGYTYVWEWPSGKLLAKMKMHSDLINSIEFGEGAEILTASDDRTAKIYSCSTCGELDDLEQRAKDLVARIRY
jgi:WD40 repeat protein